MIANVTQSRDLDTGLLSAKCRYPFLSANPKHQMDWCSVASVKHPLQAKNRAKPSLLDGPQVCAP